MLKLSLPPTTEVMVFISFPSYITCCHLAEKRKDDEECKLKRSLFEVTYWLMGIAEFFYIPFKAI